MTLSPTSKPGAFVSSMVPAKSIPGTIGYPEDLTLEEAMIYGTAGYTAGLAIEQLEKSGMSIEGKEVLVRGATGGVNYFFSTKLFKFFFGVISTRTCNNIIP
jgi:NADPH:quinone reductase-like Zn-dependent oxidoreductase